MTQLTELEKLETREKVQATRRRVTEESHLRRLTEKQLAFVSAWTGNITAAARAAGYKNPADAAYKLMKDANVVAALQYKQEAMLQESGEQFARTVPLCRADVIDRLWQLAQLAPERTNRNVGAQVRAAEALERIFALNIDKNALLKRHLEGRSEEELEFYVVHGFLPHQEPKLAEPAPPQLPESTAGSATLESLSTVSSQSTEASELADPEAKKPVAAVAETIDEKTAIAESQ